MTLRLPNNWRSSLNLRLDAELQQEWWEIIYWMYSSKEYIAIMREIFKLSTLSPFNIRRILRYYLDYTWRKSKQRAPKSLGNFTEKWGLFAELIEKLESLGFNMIYVDEASVWPQNLTMYS